MAEDKHVVSSSSSSSSSYDFGSYANPIGSRLTLYLNEPITLSALYILMTGVSLLSYNVLAHKSFFGSMASLLSNSKTACGLVGTCGVALWAALLRKIAGGKLLSTELEKNTNLEDKNIIVTGGNCGIGKETVIQLLRWRAKGVIIAARDTNKSNKLVEYLREKELIKNDDQVQIRQLDLANKTSIRNFCQKIIEDKIPVHILINNAGIMRPEVPPHTTKEGIEIQFATNHLGHFLLTNLLLDNLKKNNARIITVSSFAHSLCDFHTGFDLSEVQNVDVNRYKSNRFYGISKLANVWFTRELQRRLSADKSTSATAYSVHPGCIKTELTRDMMKRNLLYKIILPILSTTVLKNPKQGAATQLYLCAAPLRDLKPGAYYAECKPMYVSPAAINPPKEKALWELSEKLTSKN